MAYDKEVRRYGHMTTNLSECVNKVLKDCYNLPITALVKSTHSRCQNDVSSIGAYRPRVFFINGFLYFLEDEW